MSCSCRECERQRISNVYKDLCDKELQRLAADDDDLAEEELRRRVSLRYAELRADFDFI